MKFAVCVLSLGYTRLAGITLYDSKSRDFTETTPRVARELIKQGLVKGVKWKDGGFVPDPDFNMNDILVKSGVGKYRPLIHDLPGVNVNSTYMLVRVLETNKGKLYEVINNKCQRVKLTEKQLKGLCEIGPVGGVFVTEDEIKVCDGVVIENRVYPDNVVIGAEELEKQLISEEAHEEIHEEIHEDDGIEETFDGTEELESAEEPQQPVETEEEPVAEETVAVETVAVEEKNETMEQVEEPKTLEEVFAGLEPQDNTKKGKAEKKAKSSKKK